MHMEAVGALANDCPSPPRLAVDRRCLSLSRRMVGGGSHLLMGQSSPGYLHFSHVPSNCDRQIPHVSSAPSGRSHFHSATAR